MKMTTPLITVCIAATISTFALINNPEKTVEVKKEQQQTTTVPTKVVTEIVEPGQEIVRSHPAHTALQSKTVKKLIEEPGQCQPVQRPVLQVAFVLDVTGSMSGLIHTAKEKIWSIATSLTQTQPTPIIEIGLIAYRDRGDAFVTRTTELSEDIDMVYSDLMSLAAEGGGDEPESVNAGLYEAVSRLEWSKESCAYKAIFLVGDCPPHVDYGDDIQYTESCSIARSKGIFVNTIQMGDNNDTYIIWNDIADLANGDYVKVGMDAGGLTFTTPFDDEIAKSSMALESTKMYYGSESVKAASEEKAEKDAAINLTATPSAAAERAVFNITDAGATNLWGGNELLNGVANGTVNLTAIPVTHLPDEMKDMTESERVEYVDEKLEERKEQEAELKTLVTKRDKYINANVSESDAKNSINTNIYEMVKKQAASKKITLTGKAKQ